MSLRAYTTILCLAITASVQAQNLVFNGDFEQRTQCPTSLSQTSYCTGWRDYNIGNSDYFNICATHMIGIPINYEGSQAPESGEAYVGGHCRTGPYYKEYIAGSLQPTIKGHTYSVSMWVSLSDTSGRAVNGLGVWFYSKGPIATITTTTPTTLPVNPQILFPDTVRDYTNWVHLSANFTADSAYSNLVIGNFLVTQDEIVIDPQKQQMSYYYFDNVVVKEIQVSNVNNAELQDLRLYPNPVKDYLILSTTEQFKDASVCILDITGRTVFSATHLYGNNTKINISAIPEGIYILQLQQQGFSIKKKVVKTN